MIGISSIPTGVQRLVFSPAARPLRFAWTGGMAATVQLALLALMLRQGWEPLLANALAFLLAAQVNFALSMTLTWHDRHAGAGASSLARCWLLFQASIAVM